MSAPYLEYHQEPISSTMNLIIASLLIMTSRNQLKSASRAAMSSPLSLPDLLEVTNKVTDWHALGVFLKMPSEELKDIERRLSGEGIRRCKSELFTCWMKRYSNASWTEIALALDKCEEYAIADQIRQFHLPPSLPATVDPPTANDDHQLPTAAPVRLGKDKVEKFMELERVYAQLTFDLKTSLDEKQVQPMKLGRYLIDLLEEDNKLLQATTIDELFQLIKPYYCFLNTAVLKAIVLTFIGEPLKHQLEEYERQLEQFKESTSMSLLQEIGPQCSPSVGAPQVTIKLTRCWQPVTIKRFQRLVEQIFEENFTSLANITVRTGCICVTWLARKSAIPSLITQAEEKTEFMQLVGVLRVSVAGIDILEQEEEEDTFLSSALVSASSADCVDAVDMLLSILEADPNSSDSNGDTPLIIACYHGNIRIATLLLQARANINQQDNDGDTALIAACTSETPHNDLVRLLIQSGADINIKESELQVTALIVAAQCGHTSIVQYLLDEGAPVNTQDLNGFTSLMIASQNGHSEVVRVLINYGADVNILAKDPNVTALTFACSHQRTICVDLLLAGGADPNLCDRELSPLIAACITDRGQQMDPTILDKLLSAGANLNTQTAEYGNTALIEAARFSYEKGVEALLNAAADVNIQNSYGDTALHDAAAEGHLAICKILLASGAQATVTNSSGDTPFDNALNNGHHEVCELLRTRMDSDPPTTQEITKPQPHKTHRSNILPSTIKPRRGILPSIASLGRYFNKLLLPDRLTKRRRGNNQTQQSSPAANN